MLFYERQEYRDPAVSPDAELPSPLPEADKARNQQLVDKFQNQLYNATAETILDWANEHTPEAAVTLSMENTVLAELAHRHLPRADLLFLDTEYHFPETYEVADGVDKRYPARLVRATAVLNREEQDSTYGRNLYLTNPEACCRMRKVEPLQRALAKYGAWVTGIRRIDAPTRATAEAIELDKAGRLKISPLVTWSLEETLEYERHNGLIRHPLIDKGYPSIGCATCTLPVAPGEDPRSGRWAGQAKTECGLHT
ncbi:Phosphoadenosine phosphosulfate reductase [Corynebacterium kalinowskii]|uniref:Adenosine 5'-phosphosulfate reductase n=1 Tax=Corynebacterium kalinowskii TaxID=2675216 RepID=A0A6B8VRX1_9CORY|nr:phosphoadenylyl-sulfate reductase [Corynebacterium kalinowskii]QGU01506.1 Phosphoadenosine phosphosulfate reductase [Corynebacterium kalinowskii]